MILPRPAFLVCLGVFLTSQAIADAPTRSIHVFVALADNVAQGIVPVPAAIGNGEDASRNLYWGAAYGVKTYLTKSAAWERIGCASGGAVQSEVILERCAFRHRASGTQLVAEAYRGPAIGQAMVDFMTEVARPQPEGRKHLSIFVGHNGLMDASLASLSQSFMAAPAHATDAMVFACASAGYFRSAIESAGASPLVLTYGLMAPEAYAVEAAAASWIKGDPALVTRQAAAAAYAKYQKIAARGARRLFGAN